MDQVDLAALFDDVNKTAIAEKEKKSNSTAVVKKYAEPIAFDDSRNTRINIDAVNSIADAEALTRGYAVPECLNDVTVILNSRPNLLRDGRTLDDGAIQKYLIPSLDHRVKQQGWYAVKGSEVTLLPPNKEDFEETSADFYFGKDALLESSDLRLDHIALESNDERIRACISRVLQRNLHTLSTRFGLHCLMQKTQTGKKGRGVSYFLTIDGEGRIRAQTLYGQDQNSSVASKNINAIAQSIVLTQNIQWDIYKRRLVSNGIPVSEKQLRNYAGSYSEKYGINLNAGEFNSAIEACAERTPINSLHQRLLDIEARGDAGQLNEIDLRTFATDHLSPIGTEEQLRLANEMIYTWILGWVLRMQYPGITFRYMLILVGAQDGGKTAFFQILGGKGSGVAETDIVELPGLVEGDKGSAAIQGVDVRKMMTSHSIALLNEADVVFENVKVQSMRDFTSRPDEVFIDKYEKSEQKRGRTAVLAGTANELEFLQDTQGNTRFWIVNVGLNENNQLDFAWMEDNRESIIYAAVKEIRQLKAEGGLSALKNLRLSEEMTALNDRLNKERLQTGDLLSYVTDFLYKNVAGHTTEHRTPVVVQTALKRYLKELDVAYKLDDLKRTLLSLGYKQYGKTITVAGKRNQVVWIPEKETAPQIQVYEEADF